MTPRCALMRIRTIDRTLRDGRLCGFAVTEGKLARKCEVSRRTIQRDVADMRLFFDAPIEADASGLKYAADWRLFA